MEITEIFENLLKIEPKVMSIESLFHNEERVKNTDYKPSYQRNYVWDDEKATYFIESILLGTEIPPLIYFRNSEKIEVIDGRQRYQTILRFLNSDFKLKKNGLHKLDNIGIANKTFKDLKDRLQDLFWDTKLRIIEFSFYSKNQINDDMEELVKKEIFKRYNSGITPLKPTEVDKAAYIKDDLNSYIKDKLNEDKILSKDVSSILHFEKPKEEILLKKIRQLLVQHRIPIKYYSVKKDTVISKYYEFLFSSISEDEIDLVYNSFISKINLLKLIKREIESTEILYNRLIGECLFWAMSILEVEDIELKNIDERVIKKLVAYIVEKSDYFNMDRSSFSKQLNDRYYVTSLFFVQEFGINFEIYLQTTTEFKIENKGIAPKDKEGISFDELRINKPEPSSSAIVDICRQMARQRFLIRPPYQRNEVINNKKSSSIIESILLGIKLPPIFIYKRNDDISEVLDGQQRLLSILGFIQEPYLDENNLKKISKKDGYSLSLKNGILKNLNGKKFQQLSTEDKNKIKNFDLWVIEISQKNNKNFEPIDLFIRLNSKPYPIKEDTFEMWNSYISRIIIETIKSIHKNNKDWFYFRKNNSRMEDENIYTSLIYLDFSVRKKGCDENYISKDLDIYKVVDKINFRLKSKNEITKVLEDTDAKEDFVFACNEFEFSFIKKLKTLISDSDNLSTNTLNKNLDFIFNIEKGRRTQQGFYALWYFLYDISLSAIESNKKEIRDGLRQLFTEMSDIKTKLDFDKKVLKFRTRFSPEKKPAVFIEDLYFSIASIGELCSVYSGFNNFKLAEKNTASKDKFQLYRKPEFQNFNLISTEIVNVTLGDFIDSKELFEAKPKILVKKIFGLSDRLKVAFIDNKIAVGSELFVILNERSGFLTSYLIAIISSRYICTRHVSMYLTHLEESAKISLSVINRIPIPLISLIEQQPFQRVVSYIINSKAKNPQALFFQRLLDAMVYELFLKDEIIVAGSEVLKYLNDLPSISEEISADTIESVYKNLSSPDSFISASLLKLMNVRTIKEIELNL